MLFWALWQYLGDNFGGFGGSGGPFGEVWEPLGEVLGTLGGILGPRDLQEFPRAAPNRAQDPPKARKIGPVHLFLVSREVPK